MLLAKNDLTAPASHDDLGIQGMYGMSFLKWGIPKTIGFKTKMV